MGRKSRASKDKQRSQSSSGSTSSTSTSTNTSAASPDPDCGASTSASTSTTAAPKQDAKEVKRLISDLAYETCLNKHLCVLASHSLAVWNYAFKNYQQYGIGCAYWQFPSLRVASSLHSWIDMSQADEKDEGSALPIEYRSQSRAEQMEYPPVNQFIKSYNPYRETVCLVAIRTGDARDSLMKVVVIDRSVRSVVSDPSHNLLNTHWLSFASPASGEQDQVLTIIDGTRFCGNLMCYQRETQPNTFKACVQCKFQYYCSKECQVMHWKLGGHKLACANEAAHVPPNKNQPFQAFFQSKAARQQLYEKALALANASPAAVPQAAPSSGTVISSQSVLAPSS